MKAFTIKEVKKCMSVLLIGTAFDDFLISEGTITTFCTWTLDGAWQRDYTDPGHEDPAAARRLVTWKEVQKFFLSLIKGKRTPLSFKLVFLLSASDQAAFVKRYDLPIPSEDIYGLYMNLVFRDGKLLLTTGTSRRTFSTDRSLDDAWDTYVARFLSESEIDFEFS